MLMALHRYVLDQYFSINNTYNEHYRIGQWNYMRYMCGDINHRVGEWIIIDIR